MDNLFDYRRDMDALRFTPQQKAQMTAAVARSVERRTVRRPLGRMAVVAAAAVLALAVTAGAAVYQLAGDAFAPLFGTAQTEIINKIGHPIDASATDAGVTITADAILGDKYSACIIYTVTAEDGSPLALPQGVENILFSQQEISFRGGNGWSGSSWSFIDPATGVLHFVEVRTANEPLKMGSITSVFENLSYYDVAAGEAKILAEGKWKLKFDVRYEDSALSLPAGQTFANQGVNFTVEEISLSPVAIQLRYTADTVPNWGDNQSSGKMSDEMEKEQSRFLVGLPLLLTLSDGTVLDLSDSAGGSISPTDTGAECTKGTTFEQILSLEEVVSITVGDTVIPVNP